MLKLKSSLRSSLAFTIIVMGMVGVALAIVTGEIYRHLAFDNQRNAFKSLVQIKLKDIVDELIHNTTELSLTVQSTQHFRNAISDSDHNAIQDDLNEQFHRFFVTLTLIRLEKLFAFDRHFELLGYSTEGNQNIGPNNIPCPSLINQASSRNGADRLKIISELCKSDFKPFVAVLIPIGGVRLKGYLMAIVDPVLNLQGSEKQLAMPLLISYPNGTEVYRSEKWPDKHAQKKIIFVHHALFDANGEHVYDLTYASDVEPLYDKLQNTRTLIMVAAALATLLTAIFSLALLKKTTLNPLAKLTNQLRLVRQDKSHLGERVSIKGNLEICELADDFNDMTGELHVLYKTLENMAFTDSLTNLPNRALFYERLDEATQYAVEKNEPFILFMLDLDRFKYVNDTLGHHIGDQLLQEVGIRIRKAVRKSDTIARLGGDEFAAIMPTHEGDAAAAVIADKLLQVVNTPITIRGHSLTVGASIGIARCPKDGVDNNELMQHADVAMYHAKQNHRGYTFYDKELDRHSIIQLNLQSDLVEALEQNTLKLYYQPKIDLVTEQTFGVEALLRWDHTQRGFIPPDEFIPLAEQTGLIHPLTRWVLQTALSQCALWHKMKFNVSVAVNLSARSLEDAQLITTIKSALAASEIDARWLSIELTESAVMADPNRAMELLTKIHEMGVQISVDDFGTGYSSLAYLKRLPVSEIKIDKSFVMEMHNDSSDEVIVHSTIDLAHNMGISVTAEGVENIEVWNKLIKLGCNAAQGYYMCKPCNAYDITQWFKESAWGLKSNVVKIS